MSGLFVPLDVEYDSDDKIIVAGIIAEALYVRSLAFAKRTMSDGKITRAQLVVISRGVPALQKQIRTLVDVGLWDETPAGWVITGWLKRNKSARDIKADKAAKKAASELGNHERWHVGEGKKASYTCSLCYPKGHAKDDPKADPKGDPIRHRKVEPEPEPLVKPAAAGSDSAPDDEPPEDAAAAALDMLIEYRVAKTAKTNPDGLRHQLKRDLPGEWNAKLAQRLKWHPNATAADLARDVLGVPGIGDPTPPPRPPEPEWHFDPNCHEHASDGMVTRYVGAAGYPERCTCARTEPYPPAADEPELLATVTTLHRKDSA